VEGVSPHVDIGTSHTLAESRTLREKEKAYLEHKHCSNLLAVLHRKRSAREEKLPGNIARPWRGRGPPRYPPIDEGISCRWDH
jgi:hypothetical protein